MTTTAVLRSEWTKITTLRSLWLTPLASLLLTVGATFAVNAALGKVDRSLTVDPSVGIHYGLNFGQALLVCFAVLLLGQEFNSRTIDTSLLAVPRRGLLYGGKLAVGTAVGLVVGMAGTAGAFGSYAGLGFGDWQGPAAARSMAAGCLYPALLVVLCFGVTGMLRNLTAAMGLLVPTVFLLSPLLSGVPGVRRAVQFLPDRAGQYALRYHDDPQVAYGHWTGLLIMAGWAAAAAYGGWRSLHRRAG
ncbi:ABC transporter permease [Kitasatospora sp. NBC_00315]|uniref:ABC transporter permease n=1 Tax=Kitasatospora sp. NBC_00315 TaxID=2975963 RepID=UPI00324972C5